MAGATGGPVRLVVVDTNLLDIDMHNYNFARGVARDAGKLGLAPAILAPRRAPPALVLTLGARPGPPGSA